MIIVCNHCGRKVRLDASAVNRAKRDGRRIFCGRRCSGLARRKPKLPARERKAKKAAYDVVYRAHLADEIREKKREYFQRTYDPVKAARERKKKMAWHVAYCRKYYADPKRKAAKVAYDKRRRYSQYGEFSSAARLLTRLQKEICKLSPDRYERAKARGYYDRTAQQRKRDAQISRW